jgi:hypothetical protein
MFEFAVQLLNTEFIPKIFLISIRLQYLFIQKISPFFRFFNIFKIILSLLTFKLIIRQCRLYIIVLRSIYRVTWLRVDLHVDVILRICLIFVKWFINKIIKITRAHQIILSNLFPETGLLTLVFWIMCLQLFFLLN